MEDSGDSIPFHYEVGGVPVPITGLPLSGHRFSAAWESLDAAGVPVVDVEAAREIVRSEVRHERSRRWPASDVELLRAMEIDNSVERARLAAVRARYRDAPADPRIRDAADEAALHALSASEILGDA